MSSRPDYITHRRQSTIIRTGVIVPIIEGYIPYRGVGTLPLQRDAGALALDKRLHPRYYHRYHRIQFPSYNRA